MSILGFIFIKYNCKKKRILQIYSYISQLFDEIMQKKVLEILDFITHLNKST